MIWFISLKMMLKIKQISYYTVSNSGVFSYFTSKNKKLWQISHITILVLLWWRLRDSNSLPHPCEGCALPGELSPQHRVFYYSIDIFATKHLSLFWKATILKRLFSCSYLITIGISFTNSLSKSIWICFILWPCNSGIAK